MRKAVNLLLAASAVFASLAPAHAEDACKEAMAKYHREVKPILERIANAASNEESCRIAEATVSYILLIGDDVTEACPDGVDEEADFFKSRAQEFEFMLQMNC